MGLKKVAIHFLIAIALFLSAAPLPAADAVPLETLIKTAKDNNPEITAARAKAEAAVQASFAEKTWEKPKLTLEWWSIPEGKFELNKAEEKMYGIAQLIPFPGKLSLKSEAASNEAEALKWEYLNAELKIIAGLKAAYWRYWYINKSMETYLQIAEIMKNFSKISQSKYITGKASQAEALRAEVESEKILNLTITLEQEKQTVRSQINSIINKDSDETVENPAEPPTGYLQKSWAEVKSLVRLNNPEIGKAGSAVSKETALNELAKLDYLPDFDVLYRKKTLNDKPNGSDLMLGFTLPLWFWQQSSQVKQSGYNYDAAQADKRNIELTALSKAKELFSKLETDRRLLERYKDSIIPKSEQMLSVAQTQASTKDVSFIEFLDISRSYLEVKLDYYKLQVQYQENLANLEAIAGKEF